VNMFTQWVRAGLTTGDMKQKKSMSPVVKTMENNASSVGERIEQVRVRVINTKGTTINVIGCKTNTSLSELVIHTKEYLSPVDQHTGNNTSPVCEQ